MTAAELWQMAAGRRREERTRLYELAGMVWTMTGDPMSKLELHEFLRCGAFPDPAGRQLPYNAEVERKMKEIKGGRFDV